MRVPLKILIGVGVLIALAVGAVLFLVQRPTALAPETPASPGTVPPPPTALPGSPSALPTAPPPSPPVPISDERIHFVTYTADGFVPDRVFIRVGDTVKFTNQSDRPMWVASDPHPAHTDFLGFDALRGYAENERYEFVFTKSGKWNYHNHLGPAARGVVIVE